MAKGGADPPPRDYAAETKANLQAQIDLAPKVYEAEQEYGPKYTLLGLDKIQTALKGDENTPGFFSLYGQARDRFASQDQDSNELRSLLNSQAKEQLAAGGALDPALLREIQQATRQAQAARGLGFGNSDAFTEAMNVGEAASRRRAQSQAFATNVLGVNQQLNSPLLSLIGANVGSTTATSPGIFNPESPYAQDVHDTNFNAAQARQIANKNFWAQIYGSAIQAGGSIIGGAAGGGR